MNNKPPFDPNQAFDVLEELPPSGISKDKPPFDPNQPFEESTTETTQPSFLGGLGAKIEALPQLPGYLIEEVPREITKSIQDPGLASEVLARNIAQGASLAGPVRPAAAGFEKYALAPALDKFRTLLSPLLGRAATDQDVQEFFTKWVPERYESQSIQDIAAQNKAREEAQNIQLPLLAGTGQGAGMLPGIITGGQLLKAAGVGSTLLPQAISTAANIFPRSFAETAEKTGDLSQATSEATQNALLAGTLDVLGRGLIQKGAKTLSPETLTKGRNIMTRRALGGTPSEQPMLRKMETQIGEQVFPEKGPSLMGPFTTKTRLAQNLEKAAQEAGKDVGRLRGVISDAGENLSKEIQSPVSVKAPGADVPILEKNVTDSIIPKQIIDPVQEQVIGQKIAAQPIKIQTKIKTLLDPVQLDNELTQEFLIALEKEAPGGGERIYQDLLKQNKIIPVRDIKTPTLENFFKNRMHVDKYINYDKKLLANGRIADTADAEFLKIYRELFNKKLMSRAQQIDELAGTNAFDALKEANARYHVLETASKVASRAINVEESTLARNVIPSIGIPATGIAAFMGGGPLATGIGLTTAMAHGIKTFGNQFAANSLNLLRKTVQTVPQKLGKFAAPLQEATKRGPGALAALNFALYSRDPEYRQIIDPLKDEAEEELESK